MQMETTVTGDFPSKQLLLFVSVIADVVPKTSNPGPVHGSTW